MNNLSETKFVIQEDKVCPHCRDHFSNNIEVIKIEKKSSYGWQLSGTGTLEVKCHCPYCGQIYTSVSKIIPIECDSYSCPNCNESSHLEYKVCEIERNNDDFTFNAEILCKKCHNKNHFTQALKKILNIKKVEIKLTGITIERFSD
ncbi:hypothetical protein JZL89_19185 [Providencia rettgeri]|uniref:hypothetical protein n=1 Tax=Providencia rettgeri TaxID=587 RepID=UPI0019CFE998|nr:hypothetical protein [Providencia rettgeri]MBN6367479.1 hypothetical protein [Providencia rettgeri]